MDITTVSRLDSSGTTYTLTNHLSAISAHWKDGPGVGKLKAKALKEVVAWGLTKGQKYAEELGYIPLPQNVVSQALEVMNRS